MPRRRDLARSELEVARIVWKLGQATVREVVDALPPQRSLDFWTVQTYLRRLKAKGYLKARREGRADVFVPAVKPASVIRDLIRDFVRRTFDGDALPLVQHLIDDRELSDKQIEELQAKLDDLKRRKRR